MVFQNDIRRAEGTLYHQGYSLLANRLTSGNIGRASRSNPTLSFDKNITEDLDWLNPNLVF
jgi:hypothetical protein